MDLIYLDYNCFQQAKKLTLACEVMNPVDYIRRQTP